MKDQQQRVTHLFESSVSEWESIYRRDDIYGVMYQRRRLFAIALTDTIGLAQGCRVLEVGCGPGLITVDLALRGLLVHAIDIVPEMLTITRVRAAKEQVYRNVFLTAADIRHLPFRECQFDLAFVVGVSEWIDSLDRLIQEVASVIKPGGHLVIAVDNAWALHRLLDRISHPSLGPVRKWIRALLDRYWFREPRIHGYAYSAATVSSRMREAGLVKIDERTVGFGPFSLFRLKLRPRSVKVAVDSALQRLADIGVPLLRSAGHVNVVLASKSLAKGPPQS